MRSSTPSITDGKLTRVSSSSINKFDAAHPFGCPRRWWFNYVAKLEERATPNQELGVEVHKHIETFLTIGPNDVPMSDKAAALLGKSYFYLEGLIGKAEYVEEPFTTTLAGVLATGFVDVVTKTGIIDWKTSSNVKKYSKTEEELRTDTQMLIYARAFHSNLPEVTLTHGNFDTNKLEFSTTSVSVSSGEIQNRIANYVEPLVDEMKAVAFAKTAEEVAGCPEKCRRCPFQLKCAAIGVKKLMSLFTKEVESEELPERTPAREMFSGRTPGNMFSGLPIGDKLAAELARAKAPRHKVGDSPASILPPDAPKSDPKLAADPIAPDAPKKRGRPKKMQIEADLHVDIKTPTIPEKAVLKEFAFETLSLSRGATVGLPNYSSVKIDVSASVRFEGDEEEAFRRLEAFVTKRVEEESAKLLALKETK